MNEQVETNEPSVGDDTAGEAKINPGAIRKSTTQSILKAASNAIGQDIDSVDGLMAALARLSATQSTVVTNNQSQVEPTQSKRITTSDLQEQFQSLRQELQSKDQALRERDLDGEIRGAMGDRFDPDLVDYALSKVKSNIQWDDGAYQIVNNRGQIRYGSDGQPLTIRGLVEEVAKNNPKLLKQAVQPAGSGLRSGQWGGNYGGADEGIPNYAEDPAAFKAWAQRNGLGKGSGLKAITASATVTSTAKKIY